ncbi:MAG: hypothetical protein IKH75_11810 [Ruminococcus sp.]|nr:hypothetical protein [Ruminococcus sp.]
MEIVIKIPDEVIESKHYCQYFGVGSTKLYETIENGTRLPKGHGDLIDRDELSPKIHGVKSIVAVSDAPAIVEEDKG